jgi:hypothetical protein
MMMQIHSAINRRIIRGFRHPFLFSRSSNRGAKIIDQQVIICRRRQLSTSSGGKGEKEEGSMHLLKAGVPMFLFCGLGVWVVSSGIEGKNRERDAFQGRISKYVYYDDLKRLIQKNQWFLYDCSFFDYVIDLFVFVGSRNNMLFNIHTQLMIIMWWFLFPVLPFFRVVEPIRSERQAVMDKEHDEMMDKLNYIMKEDFDNTKRIERPDEVLERRRKEREAKNVWYKRIWRGVTGQ